MSRLLPFEDHVITRMARGFLSGGFFFFYGLLSVLFGSFLFPLLLCFGSGYRAKRVMRGLVRVGYKMFVFAAETLCLIRVDMSSAERKVLASSRGVVVVANHLTLIDIIILMSILPDSTCVVKGAAARNFFMGRVIRSVFLVNDDSPTGLLDEAKTLLDDGVNIVVFPEGTRMKPDGLAHHLHRGAARCALRAGATVLPVRIDCSPLVLSKHQPWYDVAARVIVYTLQVKSYIATAGLPCTHSAARALTDEIARGLFGEIK